MNNFELVKELLEKNKHLLKGDWVGKERGYEKGFCDCIGAKRITRGVFLDCIIEKIHIEIKKNKGLNNSIKAWIDGAKYADLLINKKNELVKEVPIVFLYHDDNFSIKEIHILDLDSTIKAIELDEEELISYAKRKLKRKGLFQTKEGIKKEEVEKYALYSL
jgi:hypothetical protein